MKQRSSWRFAAAAVLALATLVITTLALGRYFNDNIGRPVIAEIPDDWLTQLDALAPLACGLLVGLLFGHPLRGFVAGAAWSVLRTLVGLFAAVMLQEMPLADWRPALGFLAAANVMLMTGVLAALLGQKLAFEPPSVHRFFLDDRGR